MTSRLLGLALAASVAGAAACGGGEVQAPRQTAVGGPNDDASIATVAIEQAGLPPGFTHFRTDPLLHLRDPESPRGAFVTYANPAKETFSVGVSVEASADEAKAQYWYFSSFALDSPVTIVGTPAVQTPSALIDRHVDRLGLGVDGVTTSAIVVRHRPETAEETVSPGIVVAFLSGNVWGRVDVGYRPGTALEEGAKGYATRAIRAALDAAEP